ncbi:MAG: hypothetical protein IIY28_07760, partial [Lachnospiraceae bacterium]|nr:hypothetical protein [Lachnospiraceae bacterium]
YDHFDTTPSVPHAASRCACLDIIGYQSARLQAQNSAYADSEIWYNQIYVNEGLRMGKNGSLLMVEEDDYVTNRYADKWR